MKLLIARSIVALAAIAPSTAFASSSNSTASATLVVVDQCSISGANVDLGTYITNQTWGDVATATGWFVARSGLYLVVDGPLSRTLNMGSVTCDSGTPYTFTIKGSGNQGSAVITINSTPAIFLPLVGRVGSPVIPDENAFNGSNWGRRARLGIPGVGSGTAQKIIGTMANTPLVFASIAGRPPIPDPFTRLAAPGVYFDTLTYQLEF